MRVCGTGLTVSASFVNCCEKEARSSLVQNMWEQGCGSPFKPRSSSKTMTHEGGFRSDESACSSYLGRISFGKWAGAEQ